jgi:hypothetical protein
MPRGERASWSPATSLVTWGLALVFLIAIDAALTRTSILWGPTAFENSGGLRTVFPQTYQVLRKIYAPEGDPDARVVLLGNSRLALSLEGDDGVERAIERTGSAAEIEVSNLAIFGSYIGDMAMLSRHLDVLDPDLIVLTVGGQELSRTPVNPDPSGPATTLRLGWSDGPVPSKGPAETLDRWARTAWPLYRFREYVREALLDRLLGRPDPGPPPAHFENEMAAFRHLYGKRAPEIAAARDRFLEQQTLENFTTYVETVGPEHLERQRKRVAATRPVDASTPAVQALDEMLRELSESGRRVIVLLMPENPILDLDTRHELHRPVVLDQGVALVEGMGARYGIQVIDGRRWLPVEAFLDFHHPLFAPQQFEALLAREILDAIDARG